MTGGLLPSHAATLGDVLHVPVAHCGRCLGGVAWHGAGAWWDDDGRLGITRCDLAIDAVLIVRTAGSERRDRAIYLIERRSSLRGIVQVAGDRAPT